MRKWVTFHGLSINVDCDLTGYEGIVPCGLTGFGVTSLADLGRVVSVADVDLALRAEFGFLNIHNSPLKTGRLGIGYNSFLQHYPLITNH